MTKHEVTIYWSDEDPIFIAVVPELPGCMVHGDSRAEALQNAEDAVDLWIEVAESHGMSVPQSAGRRLVGATVTR